MHTYLKDDALGRGLRHSPEKDCLTVLDMVGQAHRKYRIERKFSALLRSKRRRIDQEIEHDFPNLPPGCNIQLERVARDHILQNIKESLGNLNNFVPEAIRTFEAETNKPLTFTNFIEVTGLTALEILRNKTWSEWKAIAYNQPPIEDPDIEDARKALRRVALRTDPDRMHQLIKLSSKIEEDAAVYGFSDQDSAALHYLLWAKKGKEAGVKSYRESFAKWHLNGHCMKDMLEIAEWRKNCRPYPTSSIQLPGNAKLQLHAAYGLTEIKAAFELADLEGTGPTGTGVIHLNQIKTYIHLVTFRKEEKDFAPTTRYKDYLISRTQLHWESQASTTQASATGKNYINLKTNDYTILFFARLNKRVEGETSPFIFLGPADHLISFQGDRPISMVWQLKHPVPAELYEEARTI